MYKIRFKKKGTTYDSGKTFRKKITADKIVRHFRQMDDDLPLKQRDKSLKTYRVVKVPKIKRMKKRKN